MSCFLLSISSSVPKRLPTYLHFFQQSLPPFFSLQTFHVWRVIIWVCDLYDVRPSVRPSVCPSVRPSFGLFFLKSYLLLQFSSDFFQTSQEYTRNRSPQNLFFGILIWVQIPDFLAFLSSQISILKMYLLLQFEADFFQTLQKCSLHEPVQNLIFGIFIQAEIPD